MFHCVVRCWFVFDVACGLLCVVLFVVCCLLFVVLCVVFVVRWLVFAFLVCFVWHCLFVELRCCVLLLFGVWCMLMCDVVCCCLMCFVGCCVLLICDSFCW